MLPPIERRRSVVDNSVKVPHTRIHEDPDKFEVALGLWCEDTGVSAPQYQSLLEILRIEGAGHSIDRLPGALKTLKRHAIGQLPLLPLRQKLIPLIPEKLPSNAPAMKGKNPDARPMENLSFFDAKILIQAFLNSDIASDMMFFGMGQFVNPEQTTELWHSHAWRSSLRTTSGKFPHYRNGDPLFVSDFVEFTCNEDGCTCTSDFGPVHVGRVFSCGEDHRLDATDDEYGKVFLEIQEAHRSTELPQHMFLDPKPEDNELILSGVRIFYVLESNIVVDGPMQVSLDYAFGDTFLDEEYRSQQAEQASQGSFFVRRLIEDIYKADSPLTSLCHTAPLRAELEIKEFTRQHFIDMSKTRCLSVPLQTFIDGFGLYRTTQRSLMGFYQIMANLPFRERARRMNVIPITLGPHGSNFADVVEALVPLRDLDQGLTMEIKNPKLDINGPVQVCAFTLMFIGDMPQQQANSGNKSQRAILGCRSCFISKNERGNLDYDIVANGRFHHQAVQMRRQLNAIEQPRAREAKGTELGMLPGSISLDFIAPALDVVVTRPSDPAHSELQGMTRRLHEILTEGILTPKALISYANFLRTQIPLPLGWNRFQSPIHHLKQYSLSDNARWCVIAPVLLRCWLREEHIQPPVLKALKELSVTNPTLYSSPASFVVSVFVAMAKSNSVTMFNHYQKDAGAIVYRARELYKALTEAQVLAAHDNKRLKTRASSQSGSQVGSRQSSRALTEAFNSKRIRVRELQEDEQIARATMYENAGKIPNLHTGVHYFPFSYAYADIPNIKLFCESGTPVQAHGLAGEEKHRYFKKVIYTTNHRNVEMVLLIKESIRQTLRLLIANGFRDDKDAAITQCLQELHLEVPNLFASLLPRSAQEAFEGKGRDEDDEDEDFEGIEDDDKHQQLKVTGAIQAKYCREILGLPTRTTKMSDSFKQGLRNAYATEYNAADIVNFPPGSLVWSKKMSYTDLYVFPSLFCSPILSIDRDLQTRITYSIGDFVYVERTDDVPRIVRIDGILIHERRTAQHLFIKCTYVVETNQKDIVLDLDLLQLADNPAGDELIIGLPAITSKPLYIVAVTVETYGIARILRRVTGLGTSTATDFVHVDWPVLFL